MTTLRLAWFALACGALAVLVPAPRDAGATRGGPSPRRAGVPSARIPFVENAGQFPAEVRYAATTFAGTVHVTAGGDLVYLLRTGGGDRPAGALLLRERLHGAGAAVVTASERSAIRVSSFRGGDPSAWARGAPAWASVHVAAPGTSIDVEVRARGGNVEKLFRVPAGGDASAIRVEVDGARSLRVGASGRLEVETSAGTLSFTEPVAWQERDGVRRRLDAAYRVDGDGYGFAVARCDPSLPLVIDPLIASTFVGRGDPDWARDIAVHWYRGDVYVVGSTLAPDYPADAGPWGMEYHGGDADAFVARLSSDLTTLLAFAYLGGGGADVAESVALGTRGVLVAGTTDSLDLPATPGVYGPSFHGGATDGWAASLSDDLETLLACTYHGGTGADRIKDVTAAGGPRIGGETDSTDLWFPERAMQKEIAGAEDLFFAYVAEDLRQIDFQSLLGGSGTESLSRIESGEGEVLATGRTTSADFPTTPGAYQPQRRGQEDAFVVRIWEDFHALLASTYLGGAAAEYEDEGGASICWVWPVGIGVGGFTNDADFPTTPGAFDTTPDAEDGGDAFVAVLDMDMTTLVASTLLGGGGLDGATAVAADATAVYVAGRTHAADFPAAGASIDATYDGGGDAFVARLTTDLTQLVAATYLGSPQTDWAQSMALRDGVVYVTGTTMGWQFPTTPGAWDTQWDTSGPQPDGFVTALTLEAGAPETDAFILPRKVAVRRRVPESKSRLSASGTFDTGSAVPVFSGAATLTVGGTEFAFPALGENRRGVYRYAAEGVDFRVTPSKFGSSRAAFALKVSGAAAGGVGIDAPLEMRFRTQGVDGRGEVLLSAGRYQLGRARGALIAPSLFPYNCSAKLTDSAKDTLRLKLGLASAGATPASAPEFTLRLGDGFEQTLAPASFERKGDSFVFRGPPGALTSVTLDYARERIVLGGRALELGEYVQGAQPVRVTVKVGDEPERSVVVRMLCKAVRLRY